MKATGLLPANISQALVLENLLTENFWRDADSNRWREPTAEERERMNDDRSLRVLHDAERFVNNTLDLPTTDTERCEWIEVLFQACRAIEDNEADALPALRGFDKAEAYSLIPRLFQSILRDHVSKDAYSRAEKQARAAAQRVARKAEDAQEAKAKSAKDGNQTTQTVVRRASSSCETVGGRAAATGEVTGKAAKTTRCAVGGASATTVLADGTLGRARSVVT